MNKLILKRNKFLEKIENAKNEYNEFDVEISNMEFGDLWGKNRFAEKQRLMRINIKRLESIVNRLDEEIRTGDIKYDLCYLCDEEIEKGKRLYIYKYGISRKFCSRQCQKYYRNKLKYG